MAYCMRCKAQKNTYGDSLVIKNGRSFIMANCVTCDTKTSVAQGRAPKHTNAACPQCEKHGYIPEGDYICTGCRESF